MFGWKHDIKKTVYLETIKLVFMSCLYNLLGNYTEGG